MTDLRISRVHAPVTTLGPGRRLGIWFQGCSIGCAGCVSRDTWSTAGGTSVSVSEIVSYFQQKRDALSLTGVTISGGEPFDQPDGLLNLLNAFDGFEEDKNVDILCYSGFSLSFIKNNFPAHIEMIDALIPEPFAPKRGQKAAWRGSANQPLVLLSELAHQRFGEQPEISEAMQVVVKDQQIWMVGVPRVADMSRLERMVAERGLLLEDVSWLA